jgi:hypothetical protein
MTADGFPSPPFAARMGGGISACGAAKVGAALVNISENTSAAVDGDAAGAPRKGSNCL